MKSSCARIASESLARAARPSHLRSRTGAFPPVVRTRSVIATTSTPTTTTTTGSCSSRSRTCQTASFSTVRTLLAKQEYEPATTWEGLEWIGTPEWKSERRALQREPGPEVFPSIPLVLDVPEIEYVMCCIVVEAFLLKEAGKLDTIASLPFPRYPLDLLRTVSWGSPASSSTPVDGDRTLQFQDSDAKAQLLGQMTSHEARSENESEIEAEAEADAGSGSIKDAKTQDEIDLSSGAPSFWREAPLADTAVKFAIAKRFLKLTGHRVSDFDLLLPTAGDLTDRLVGQVFKNKRVADVLADDAELGAIPNLTIHRKPLTLADKETEVGRWKVIEKVLQDRDLPLTTRS